MGCSSTAGPSVTLDEPEMNSCISRFYLLIGSTAGFLSTPSLSNKAISFHSFLFYSHFTVTSARCSLHPWFNHSITTFSSCFFLHSSWLYSPLPESHGFFMANAERIHNCFIEQCIKSNITAHPQPHAEICNSAILFQVNMAVANYFVPWCDILPRERGGKQMRQRFSDGCTRLKYYQF